MADERPPLYADAGRVRYDIAYLGKGANGRRVHRTRSAAIYVLDGFKLRDGSIVKHVHHWRVHKNPVWPDSDALAQSLANLEARYAPAVNLLRRIAKYCKEDEAKTAGATRLERALAEVDAALKGLPE